MQNLRQEKISLRTRGSVCYLQWTMWLRKVAHPVVQCGCCIKTVGANGTSNPSCVDPVSPSGVVWLQTLEK